MMERQIINKKINGKTARRSWNCLWLITGLLGLIVCFQSCYYDVEEEIYPTTDCIATDMSYQDDILPLISSNCYRCHDAANNFGNITLEGYEKLIIQVNNGNLIGAISHEPGFSPMPQGAPKLLECQLEKIESWIINGAPNN